VRPVEEAPYGPHDRVRFPYEGVVEEGAVRVVSTRREELACACLPQIAYHTHAVLNARTVRSVCAHNGVGHWAVSSWRQRVHCVSRGKSTPAHGRREVACERG
jgi:hypothetical protein